MGIDVIPVDPMDSIGRLRTPLSKCFSHFRFHLMTRLPVTRVDSTVLPVSFFDQTPLDSRFCPLESSREYWTCVWSLTRISLSWLIANMTLTCFLKMLLVLITHLQWFLEFGSNGLLTILYLFKHLLHKPF